MNSYELCKPDGTATGLFVCGECRLVYSPHFYKDDVEETKNKAEECCNKKCIYCEEELEKTSYYLSCDKCRKRIEKEKEKEMFDKAEKITIKDWDGPIFVEDLGSNDGFFENTDELEEHIYDMNDGCEDCEDKGEHCNVCEGGIIVPEYAWACNRMRLSMIDASDVCESYCIDYLPEDYQFEDLNGFEELQKALDKFVAENQNVWTYEVDYKKVIVLK